MYLVAPVISGEIELRKQKTPTKFQTRKWREVVIISFLELFIVVLYFGEALIYRAYVKLSNL